MHACLYWLINRSWAVSSSSSSFYLILNQGSQFLVLSVDQMARDVYSCIFLIILRGSSQRDFENLFVIVIPVCCHVVGAWFLMKALLGVDLHISSGTEILEWDLKLKGNTRALTLCLNRDKQMGKHMKGMGRELWGFKKISYWLAFPYLQPTSLDPNIPLEISLFSLLQMDLFSIVCLVRLLVVALRSE